MYKSAPAVPLPPACGPLIKVVVGVPPSPDPKTVVDPLKILFPAIVCAPVVITPRAVALASGTFSMSVPFKLAGEPVTLTSVPVVVVFKAMVPNLLGSTSTVGAVAVPPTVIFVLPAVTDDTLVLKVVQSALDSNPAVTKAAEAIGMLSVCVEVNEFQAGAVPAVPIVNCWAEAVKLFNE